MKMNKVSLLLVLALGIMLIGSVSAAYTTADCKSLGGTVSIQNSHYCVHVFLTNSSFNITRAAIPVEVLIVAGGGGGGSGGGGGGAGGLIYNASYLISANTTIKIGSGGNGALTDMIGSNGANSSFGSLIAIGGGGGGSKVGGSPNNGGSGGGAGRDANVDYGGNGVLGQGYSGGGALGSSSTDGGGGGGANMSGFNGTTSVGGNGGNGLNYSINGTNTYYAGGGGGGTDTIGAEGSGGLGGGGNGNQSAGRNATNNLGGGGGGGGHIGGVGQYGGKGGTGIIVIRYDLIPSISTVINSPLNDTIVINSSMIFNSTSLFVNGNLTNATLYIWNSTGIFNRTTKILTGIWSNQSSFNITNFNLGTYYANVLGCGTNRTVTDCEFAPTNITFTYGISNAAANISSQSYETQTAVPFNVTYQLPAGTTTTAYLWYDGISYLGTTTNVSSLYTSTKSLDIPIGGTGNKSTFWEIYSTMNGYSLDYNTTDQNQTINPITFGLCNATNNVPYLNFTFKDETSSGAMNATADDGTSFVYWFSSITSNKTYSFTNNALNSNYDFCFSPANNNLNLNTIFKYSSGTSYPQRTYVLDNQILTNVTTNTTLYLLSSAYGIYSSIQVISSTTLQVVSGVAVSVDREIGGVWVTVSQGVTDSSGLFTSWVNPNYNHRITASKNGFVTTTQTIQPTQSTYTLLMTQIGSGSNVSYTSAIEGLSWHIYPMIGQLNYGSQFFQFNLTDSNNNLIGCIFNIVNQTNGTVATLSGGNSSACSLPITYTVLPGQTLFGKAYVATTASGGYFQLDADAKWISLDINSTTAWTGLTGIMKDLKTMREFGKAGNEQEFSMFILFFFIGTLLLAILTFTTGWEVNTPFTGALIVWILMALGTVGGFFTMNYGSDNIPTGSFLAKWFVFIIFSLYFLGYSLSTWRKMQ